jgi:(p)ppGpp synthase/HD superfamily hydrolase
MALERALGTVAEEVAAKNASTGAGAAAAESDLRTTSAERLDPDAAAQVEQAIGFARSLPFADNPTYDSLAAYLAHPFRIAAIALRLDPDPSPFSGVTGVLHNVFEVSGLSEHDLEEAGLGGQVARAVRLLTVDRAREHDTAYLDGYYAAIRDFGPRLVLVKCVDKLDNFLGLETFPPGEVRDTYLTLGERYVAPLADDLDPWFGAFFRDTVAHMRGVAA